MHGQALPSPNPTTRHLCTNINIRFQDNDKQERENSYIPDVKSIAKKERKLVKCLRLCWEFAFGANVVKFYSEQVFDPDIHRRGRDEGA
jgi:hypothetical protein